MEVIDGPGLGLGLGLEFGLGLSSRASSLSLRLVLLLIGVVVLVGVNTRRGGKRIVLVFMVKWMHDTSAPKPQEKQKVGPNY